MERSTGSLEQIVADEIRRDDKKYTDPLGNLKISTERYLLQVLPGQISATIRAVALHEIQQQEGIKNPPSQILVDNMPIAKHGIERAKRRVVARFQDTQNLLEAVKAIYESLQRATRIQMPPRNSIVARSNFHLYVDGVNLGLMPGALTRIAGPGVLTQSSVVRVVGPLVPYGRKSFWNPVGMGRTMQYNRVNSKRSGVRFLVPRGKDVFYPRFKPYAPSTVKRKNRGNAAGLQAMLSGATPPGRAENVGQIVKRVLARNPKYRGLHFTDGWIEYGPATGWSKLRDSRVPAVGVMFSKRGGVRIGY